MTMKKILLLCVIMFLIFLHLSGCGPRGQTAPQSADSVIVPYQEFSNTTLQYYDGPILRWKLITDYMKKNLNDTARALVAPVDLFMYDSSGSLACRVFADSGLTNADMEDLEVWGDVEVKRSDGLIILSEHLTWHRDRKKVTSDAYVEIRHTTGDILRGKGLDATETFSSFNFHSNVTGKFPKFRERVEADEF